MIRFTVRDRIFVMIIGVGTVIFSLLLAAVYTHTTRAFKESLGGELHRLAEQMASRIELSLTNEIEKTVVLAHHENLIGAAEEANRRYRGMSSAEIQKTIEGIDKEWSLSDKYEYLYQRSSNPSVELLSSYQDLYPEKVAELFITDAHGGLVASTNRTSDYQQADEDWWQAAFSGGRGAVYVGGLGLDESARVYSVTIAVPIMDQLGGRALGVLKSVIDVHRLLEMVASYKLGETGHMHLADSSGQDIFKFAKAPATPLHSIGPEQVRGLIERGQSHTLVTDRDGKTYIVGLAQVTTPEALGAATFGGQGWHVLVFQDLKEAYAPVYRLMKTLLALGLVALIALYLTVLITARTITKPLGKLRRGTQKVRDGQLEHRVELATGDELQELAESFNEMTEELMVAYAALEQAQAAAIVSEKLAAVGRLTAGVSHEILNPLNIITMRLHLMIKDPLTPQEVVGPLQVLDEQAHRISKIIKELLYFARQKLPDRRPTDLNEALMRTLSLVGPDMRLANIELEFVLDEELPQVLVDQDQLQQVMLNLLSNAQEAMPSGGRLSFHTDALKANGRRWVELRVVDTGEGIDPAHQDKLFEPFFTTKPEGEGNGLGLAICKGIIDSHGGALWAENNPDGGATFVVRLEADSEEG